MTVNGLTLKFTQEELRDSIAENKFGSTKPQSRKFHQLDAYGKWNGETHALKSQWFIWMFFHRISKQI